MRLLILFLLPISIAVQAQQVLISGHIINEKGSPVEGVNISANQTGTFSDGNGSYALKADQFKEVLLQFTHVNYLPFSDTIITGSENIILNITLRERTTVLDEVSVYDEPEREKVSLTKLQPKNLIYFPLPSPDISRIIASLPGVVSNNELSNSYSVRGGNFDENLIYVEGIPVYKPQLVSNGQQEGLGFVNLSMAREVSFSAGGWSTQYGDRLSSVLSIDYKEPDRFTLDAMAGLMGGHLTVGAKKGNTSFVAGARHKNIRYLLNTLEVEGEYFPRFTDFQFFSTTRINATSSISALAGYASNNYEVIPATRETEFGTINQALRLTVAFEGIENLKYNTFQSGLKFSKSWNSSWSSSFIASVVRSIESEYTEVEGGYRLCDVNKNPGSAGFNECVVYRGIGSMYDHRRNLLESEMLHLEWQNKIELSNGSAIQGGVAWNLESFNDRLSEFSFTDSADYVTEVESVHAEGTLDRSYLTSFLEWEKSIDQHFISAGGRLIYRSITNEVSFNPVIRYAFTSKEKDLVWKLASGIYRQLPVYREFRKPGGDLNLQLKMQSSWHLIGGFDKNLRIWDRPFKMTGEIYYKYLWNVNPYEVNNVRIRYFGNNDAEGYAAGIDFRLSGEFIKNTESWFSLSILSTRENIFGDGKGFIRRPMDQRMTMAIFFQDHLPDNPSFLVNVHVQVGTGLPFGPPDNIENRNMFSGDAYRRVDIGFSKVFEGWNGVDHFSVSAEILNLTGSLNVISYTWIEDVNNAEFAVPNSLSARFFNLKLAISL